MHTLSGCQVPHNLATEYTTRTIHGDTDTLSFTNQSKQNIRQSSQSTVHEVLSALHGKGCCDLVRTGNTVVFPVTIR